MTDKENAAAAPASSLITHVSKRESFLAGATQIGVTSTKATSSRLMTCKDLSNNPRTQQVLPAKAVGLLSIHQMQAAQRGNAASRQKTDTTAGNSKAGLIVPSRDNNRRAFRAVGQNHDQKKQQPRQFKSVSHIGD